MKVPNASLPRPDRLWLPLVLVLALSMIGGARAEGLSGAALLDALRAGGVTIYFRHAQTNWNQSDRAETVNDITSCAPERMRQLSSAGRETAKRVGAAIRAIGLAVSSVRSSPYCRARETAELMQIGDVAPSPDIMNLRSAGFFGGRDVVIRRIREIFAAPVPAGEITVIAAHGNLVRDATGAYPGEAGSVILRADPTQPHGFEVVQLLTAEDWYKLARLSGQ
jgi:hypothetical protein